MTDLVTVGRSSVSVVRPEEVKVADAKADAIIDYAKRMHDWLLLERDGMSMDKDISIERANNRPEWGIAIRDKLGVTHSWAPLDGGEIAKLIESVNAASEQGAPWPKYVKHARM